MAWVMYQLETISQYMIVNSETVCKYVTKYVGKDVDYDIIFKS